MLETFAKTVSKAGFQNLLGVFSIGSLPGGYFRPWQSDLDVMIVLSGMAPGDDDQQAINKNLHQLIKAFASQTQPFKIDCQIRYENEFFRGKGTGELPCPDLIARLILQSRQLWGHFAIKDLQMPSAADFGQELKRYLTALPAKNQTMSSLPAHALVNHALTLARLYMAFKHDFLEYDKTRIVPAFQRLIPEAVIPVSLKQAVSLTLGGVELNTEELSALRRDLPGFQTQIEERLP